MHSSITAKIEDLKQDLATHLEYVTMMICTELYIPADLPSFAHVCKLKVKLLPIPFSPITFNGTYTFHGWM